MPHTRSRQMRSTMRRLIGLYCLSVLVGSAWNETTERRRTSNGQRRLFGHIFSNKSTEIAQKFEEFSSTTGQKFSKFASSLLVPVSSDVGSGVLENVGYEYVNVANKSVGALKDVADHLADVVFSDQDILNIQKSFAKKMGIHTHHHMDVDRFRHLLGGIIDSNTRILSTDATLCGICKLIVKNIQLFGLRISKVGEFVCNLYITIATLTVSDFCKQLIEINMPVLDYVVKNSQILDPELACTIILQTKDCYYQKPALSWTTTLPITKPVYPKIPPKNTERKKPLKILHLTDPHISMDYQKGAVANCGYPVCCKKNLGNAIKRQKAGYWGDYNCDISPWMFESALDHIKDAHQDLDFVYFTGDIIDHTVWNSSVAVNSEIISYAFSKMQTSFPNISIFPVIGNHESSPLNLYAPSNSDIDSKGLSTTWLYELMAKLWSPWLNREALVTVKKQGYYAHSLNSKLKIIGLNNNLCYNYNWWLMFDTAYLNEQLQFLIKELEKSEKSGQCVHILGHVPVGNEECIEPWENSYNAIVRRYSHIIKGQFVGHTHTDELKIFYDCNYKPINVAHNGASLTPYTKNNPNYKVLEVDPDTMDILDIHTYVYNLTEANLHEDQSPAWYKLYSVKQAYGLSDLSPQSFDSMVDIMSNNSTLMNQYWRFYVRDGDASLKDGCDKNCKTELFCKIVTTHSRQPAKPGCEDV